MPRTKKHNPASAPAKPATSSQEDVSHQSTHERLMLLLKTPDIAALDAIRAEFARQGVELTRQKTMIAAIHQLVQRQQMDEARRAAKPRKPLRNR